MAGMTGGNGQQQRDHRRGESDPLVQGPHGECSRVVGAARGFDTIAVASTGNAAVSVAAYAAAAELRCVVLGKEGGMVSSDVERSLQAMGAEVRLTTSWRDRWTELELGVREQDWYPVSNYHTPPVSSQPIGVRAYRTIAYEIAEQFAYEIAEQLEWSVPDWVVVPVSRGDALCAMVAGFDELRRLGWTSHVPRMLAVVRFFPACTRQSEVVVSSHCRANIQTGSRRFQSVIPSPRPPRPGRCATAGATSWWWTTTTSLRHGPTLPHTAGCSSSPPPQQPPARPNCAGVATKVASSPWPRRRGDTSRRVERRAYDHSRHGSDASRHHTSHLSVQHSPGSPEPTTAR